MIMKKETIKKLYKRVDNILSNLSAKDFWMVNKNSQRAINGRRTKTGKERKWNPYSLSEETEEARKVLSKIKLDMTKEDEAEIKGFIMRYFIMKPEFIDNPNFILDNTLNKK